MKFLGQVCQKLEHEQDRQTDKQTGATERITTAASAGDSKMSDINALRTDSNVMTF